MPGYAWVCLDTSSNSYNHKKYCLIVWVIDYNFIAPQLTIRLVNHINLHLLHLLILSVGTHETYFLGLNSIIYKENQKKAGIYR